MGISRLSLHQRRLAFGINQGEIKMYQYRNMITYDLGMFLRSIMLHPIRGIIMRETPLDSVHASITANKVSLE